jgi:hypothetical protein
MHRVVAPLLVLVMACGDDGAAHTTTSSGSSDSSGDTTSTSTSTSTTESTGDTSSSSTTVEDTGTGSSESGTEGSSSGSSSGTTTDPPVELEVTLSDPMAFMDCMPIVAPDPLNLSVTMLFDNPGDGIGPANVTEARLSSGGVEAVSFELVPASFGPFDPNDMTTADAMKVEGSADPQEGCDTLQCGADYDLEIVFDVDGTEVLATTMVTVQCAF